MFDSNSQNEASSALASRQLSLLALFYLTTLTAVFVGVYIYVSPLLAMLCGGALVVVGVVRAFGHTHLVLGGLIGFLTATILAWLIVSVSQNDTSTTVAALLLFPTAGYVLGACVAELRNAEI